MLRMIFLLLVLANGAYFAWGQGWLKVLGFAPAVQGEPQRMAQQIRPQVIQPLSAQDMRRSDADALAPAKPTECLQAGLFDEAQALQLRRALETGLAAGSWQIDFSVEPARWIIYMGKFPNDEALTRKRNELATLSLQLQPITNPALEPGLSLGGFDSQAAAEAELAALGRRGVRTARVVVEREEARGSLLKLVAVDDVLRAKLEELKPALAAKPLRPCK